MPRFNYGTSRLYDEYAANINSYVQEVYGMEYYKAIKMCPDLTPAAVKTKDNTRKLKGKKKHKYMQQRKAALQALKRKLQ